MSSAPEAKGRIHLARSAETALLLLASALLCGLRLPSDSGRTLAFEPFGFVEGVLALVVLGLFLHQGVLAAPASWMDRAGLAYWFAATAVMLRNALPPAGLGYWIGTGILAAALLGASGGDDRRRTLVTLAIAVALCGVLRFAVIPFIWRNATLPDVGPFELEGISDWAKGLVSDYEPVRPVNEILNAAGLALYGLAIRRAWPERRGDAVAALSDEDRDRLLQALLAEKRTEAPSGGPEDRRSASRSP